MPIRFFGCRLCPKRFLDFEHLVAHWEWAHVPAVLFRKVAVK